MPSTAPLLPDSRTGAQPHRRDAILTAIAGLALVPPLLLVAAGFADRSLPAFLTHPVIILGGLLVALLTSFLVATQWELRREADGFRISCTIRYRAVTLAVLALGLLLLAVITGYLFVENYQPRVLE